MKFQRANSFKRSVASADLQTPPPKKRGGASPATGGRSWQDKITELNQSMLNQIVDECEEHPEYIQFLYNELQKQKTEAVGKSEAAPEAETFDDPSFIGKLDTDFKLSWVVGHSDLTTRDIVEMMKRDNQVLNYLVQLGTQIGLKTRLPPDARIRDVMKIFFDKRERECKNRLANIKANGGITSEWDLDIVKIGAYGLEFNNEGLLCSVTHRPTGHKASAPPEARLSKSYMLADNFDDLQAHLYLKPLPPVRLCSFYDTRTKQGPYSVQQFVGKPKELQKYVTAVFKSWESDALVRKGRGAKEAVQEIQQHAKEQQKEQMDAAREKAKEALAKQKAKRAFQLK